MQLCETFQDLLQDTVRQCIDQPAITADQWDLARLPIQAGGLYLPHLPSLAVIARTAALATMPRASRTASYRHNLLKEERAELFACLRGFCHTEPTAVAGNLDDPPPGMSLRHLSRKLTQSRDSAAINAFWLRRQDLPTRLRHAWLCNLPGDNPARPWESTSVFKWGLQRRMGFHAPGAGFKCGRTPQGESLAMLSWTSLDDTRACAIKGYTLDAVRDHIAKVARQAGLTAQIEQKMLIPKRTANPPRAVCGPFIEQTCTLSNLPAQRFATFASTRRTWTSRSAGTFSEKSAKNAGPTDNTASTSTSSTNGMA